MPSQLVTLGCSGGIDQHLRTTSLLLDQDILIDAGTGVGDLPLDALAKIDTVFITHSHLDHIAALPLLLDSVGALRTQPVQVYALEETIDALKTHVFNDIIWPDFSRIPSPQQPFVVLDALTVGQSLDLGARRITALPANHSVPAVGYAITANESTIVFSGDSGPCEAFWSTVNTFDDLKHLIIETSFTDRDFVLANLSQHYCPRSLAQAVEALTRNPQIWISHLKPGQGDQIMTELNDYERLGRLRPLALKTGQILSF